MNEQETYLMIEVLTREINKLIALVRKLQASLEPKKEPTKCEPYPTSEK